MGERGSERRRTEFDIDVMVRRLEALYEELRAKALATARSTTASRHLRRTAG